jgi:hypothetical protein
VEPPHARDVAVVYPEGAHGQAVVVIELIVGDDGHVIDSRVLAGGEPFLHAVRAALPTFTFEPATRDAKPVAARIRIEIPFREAVVLPPPRVEILEVVPPKLPPKVLPAVKGPIEDVHVRGKRTEIGGTIISKEEVRDLPGAFGDAFRAIDMMPGVVPIVSGLPFFFVRGAPPGNTGYFLDDVRVPLLYHLALGPSVVHPSLIERVDFYPGGYPPSTGASRVASSPARRAARRHGSTVKPKCGSSMQGFSAKPHSRTARVTRSSPAVTGIPRYSFPSSRPTRSSLIGTTRAASPTASRRATR